MRTEDERIEAAIAVLPFLPQEFRNSQAGQITGWLYPQLQSWSHTWSRQAGDSTLQLREELVQVAALAILKALIDHSQGHPHPHVDHWVAFLYRVGQLATRTWVKSSAVGQLSGMTNHERRMARIPSSLSTLRHDLGRDPSSQELFEYHNGIMRSRQARPEKHGSLITLADARAVLSR